MKNIISIKDLSIAEIDEIMNGAEDMQKIIADPFLLKKINSPLKSKITLFFAESSTRTRGSFSEAARRLNFDCYEISGAEATSLSKKESLADTARMFASKNQGADIIAVRTNTEGAPRFIAEILDKMNCETAIINAGDGMNQHPTQALLDLFTISKYFGRKNIPDLTIGFMGDLAYSRVAHSDLLLFRLLGVKKIRLVSMPEAKIQAKYKDGFTEIIESEDIKTLSDCDVVIALRVQEERYTDPMKRETIKGKFRITPKNINLFKKEAIIMHPLPNPINTGEIDPCLYNYNKGPKVIVHEQAANGIPIRMQILNKSYQERQFKNNNQTASTVELEKIREESAKECLEKQRNKKMEFFRPINPETGTGIIIDHLPLGQGIIVQSLLEKTIGNDILPIHTIKGVLSGKYGKKDVIIIENNCLILENNDLLATISLKYGERTTLHLVKDKMYRKFKLNPPIIIKKLLACPNPNCVTNHEPESTTCFHNKFPDLGIVECAYCEREFPSEDLKPI
ncbi:MAG: aspartate carbamoyltransferase [Parcubacteria group bacterium GW2011_GWA2_38_13b]|nr:MAG: aspartate carbamoyltransferase [Parcubacteria group bacterium GW2011_GWA2_38_13b]